METPSIAAIIPLYNGAPYIRDSVKSVLSQTLQPAEIIVVDDGSTDEGPRIVEELAKENPITLLTKPNGGQGSARNFGVAHSRSPLIALLDQDDIWYRTHLETLVQPFCESRTIDLGWVYSNLDEVDESGQLVVRAALRMLQGVQHPKVDLRGCLATDMFVLPSASLMSRQAFDAVGGFDERLRGYEDDDLFLRMFRAGYDNVYIDEPLSQWRIFGKSSSYSPRMAVSRMVFLRKLIEEFPDEPDRNRFWQRDVVIPRFMPMLVSEYTKAVRQQRDPEIIRASLEDICYASSFHNRRVRTVVQGMMPLLRMPGVAQLMLAASRAMNPLVRRMLR